MAYKSTESVSAVNTPEDPRLRGLGMAPLGACVWTGSGGLAEQGITAIAHAASGAMGHNGEAGFDPTPASVEACIENAFRLTAAHGHDRLALPFIAGGIFLHRIRPAIDEDALAKVIVEACIRHRGAVEAVIVAHGASDLGRFTQALADGRDSGTSLVQGSITRYADHGCAAIANAANMEVVFGGGVSGIIGSATGQIAAIDAEAAAAIAGFWAANPP
jgi:O-acetyl-ADP-ribose deacetylase (regulator of RNase III)